MPTSRGRATAVEGAAIGLAVAFFTLAGSQGEGRPMISVILLLLWPLIFAAVVLKRRLWPAAGYLLLLGVLVRLAILQGWAGVPPAGVVGSDVLSVTREALEVATSGGNPYTHAFEQSVPPGIRAFAYPPGNLLYYLPAYLLGNIRIMEIVAAGVVLAGLALAAGVLRSGWPVVAMGLYAAAPPLITLSTDNSNDTSAGALLFAAALALLLARRRSSARLLVVAGALMGWALGFKSYAVPLWLFLVAALAWQRWTVALGRGRGGMPRLLPAWLVYAAASAGFLAVLCLPYFVRDPVGFVRSMVIGPVNPLHTIAGWNVWALAYAWFGWDADRGLGSVLPYAGLAAMAVVILLGLASGVRRMGRGLLFGALAWFAAMFFARWTTYAYFAGIAPVVLLIPIADRLAGMGEEDPQAGEQEDDRDQAERAGAQR